MHASQIQGCVVEQRAEKKRKIAESVWVHNVVNTNLSLTPSRTGFQPIITLAGGCPKNQSVGNKSGKKLTDRNKFGSHAQVEGRQRSENVGHDRSSGGQNGRSNVFRAAAVFLSAKRYGNLATSQQPIFAQNLVQRWNSITRRCSRDQKRNPKLIRMTPAVEHREQN